MPPQAGHFTKKLAKSKKRRPSARTPTAHHCDSTGEAAVKHFPSDTTAAHSEVALHEWGYRPRSQGWLYQSVCNPFWRLYYNSQSGHSIQTGDAMLGLGPDHLVLIPPQCIFHCHGKSPAPHFWIHFSYPRHLAHNPPKPVLLPPLETELSLIRALQSLRIEKPHLLPCEKDLFLGMALIHAVLSREELSWRSSLPDALQRILVHIEQNLSTDFTNADLAKIGGLSAAGLSRNFQKYLQTSPALHVLHLRIKKASVLLQEKDHSIELVAEQSGFSNRYHFSHMFKKMTGKTPAQFRKEHHDREFVPELPSPREAPQ